MSVAAAPGKINPARHRSASVSGRFPARTFIAVPVAVVVYGFVLHFVYKDFILEPFRYAGLRYHVPSIPLALLVVIVATGTALVLPTRITRPSAIVLWVLFVVVVAPSMLMAPYLGFLDGVGVTRLTVVLGLAFSVVTVGSRARLPKSGSRLSLSPPQFCYVIAGFSGLVYLSLALTAGVSFRYLSVLDVYDVRGDYSEALQGSGILGYLVSTQANVVNPIIIAAGLYSRRFVPVVLGIGGQLVLYSSTGFKTMLFSIPAILIISFMFRRNLRPWALKLIWGGSGVVLASAAVDYLQSGILWSSLLARRFLFTPARLTSVYFDYYDSHPWHLLGNSTLGSWIHSPYHYGPARTISIYLTGSPGTSMNANLFADGFAQFGVLGVVLMSILLLLYLRLLDRAARGLPVAVSSLVIVMPAVTLSNSPILTSIFSHGLMVAIVILAIAPRGVWGRRRLPIS